MKLAIFGRYTENTHSESVAQYLRYLREKGVEYGIHAAYALEMRSRIPEELIDPLLPEQPEGLDAYDFALSFGGDGTFLNTVNTVGGRLPLLGVNFGRLGFLTTISHEHLETATEELLKGMYRIDQRSGLWVESNPRGLFGDLRFGLNDLTIHKSQSNEMITVHTFINGEFLNSYWGDGLIVATPTGSTAYSLSCGGPIMHPNSNNFVITPVAPHSLTVRPVIIPDDFVISFEIESRTGHAMIALDTRTELVNERVEIAVRKADFNVRMVRVAGSNYLDNLRRRLMWGRDSRN